LVIIQGKAISIHDLLATKVLYVFKSATFLSNFPDNAFVVPNLTCIDVFILITYIEEVYLYGIPVALARW